MRASKKHVMTIPQEWSFDIIFQKLIKITINKVDRSLSTREMEGSNIILTCVFLSIVTNPNHKTPDI